MNEWVIHHSSQWLLNTAVVRPPSVAAGAELSSKHVCWDFNVRKSFASFAPFKISAAAFDIKLMGLWFAWHLGLTQLRLASTYIYLVQWRTLDRNKGWMNASHEIHSTQAPALTVIQQPVISAFNQGVLNRNQIKYLYVWALTCMLCSTGFNYPTTFMNRTLLHFHFGFDLGAWSNEYVVIITAISS